jgi:hypothetical protein
MYHWLPLLALEDSVEAVKIWAFLRFETKRGLPLCFMVTFTGLPKAAGARGRWKPGVAKSENLCG